jgi:hypothetical protein
MFQVESRIGKISADRDEMFALISDFTNISRFLPEEKLKGIQAEKESLTFTLPETGEMTMKIEKKEPPELLKYAGVFKEQTFYLYLQFKSPSPGDTRFKITLRAEIPSMIGWTLKGKMQTMLDGLVEQIEKIYS